MKNVQSILENIKEILNESNLLSFERRQIILDEMSNLKEQQIHCYNCTGKCCTFIANSMQVTPIEAVEILTSIQDQNLEELTQKLQATITEFRLDQNISIGRRGVLRKTYTCPFFSEGPKGCGVKKELKPYGCLAFNPTIESDNGLKCRSDNSILETREKQFTEFENKHNLVLKTKLGLLWDKRDIPSALIDIIEKVKTLRP